MAAIPLEAPSVLTALKLVHRAVDSAQAAPVVARDVEAAVRECDRAIARLHSLRLRVIAAAVSAGVDSARGNANTGAWLSGISKQNASAAANDARLADAIGHDELPVTAEALDAGEVSPAHASVIDQALRNLPAALDEGTRAAVEASLVEAAKTLTPAQLRRRARRCLDALNLPTEQVDAHEDDQLADEEDLAFAKSSFSMHDNHDGTHSGQFTVPTFAAMVLKKLIDALTSPRREAQADAGNHTSSGGRTFGRGQPTPNDGPADAGRAAAASDDRASGASHSAADRSAAAGDAHRDPAQGTEARWQVLERHQRLGQAFAQILEHLNTDRLPTRNAATVVVTIPLTSLQRGYGAARTETGHDLSAGQLRRLACDAGIVPTVLNGRSVPLDLGVQHRLFNEAQRTALATLYEACAAHGCDRPFAWTELHHLKPWAHGGRTDLRNAVPLCGYHHRLIHARSHTHACAGDGSGRITVTFFRK